MRQIRCGSLSKTSSTFGSPPLFQLTNSLDSDDEVCSSNAARIAAARVDLPSAFGPWRTLRPAPNCRLDFLTPRKCSRLSVSSFIGPLLLFARGRSAPRCRIWRARFYAFCRDDKEHVARPNHSLRQRALEVVGRRISTLQGDCLPDPQHQSCLPLDLLGEPEAHLLCHGLPHCL